MIGTVDHTLRRSTISEPSRSGSPKIDDEQVDRPQRRRAQAVFSGAGFEHGKLLHLEAGAKEAPDLQFVIDDQDNRPGFTHRIPRDDPDRDSDAPAATDEKVAPRAGPAL